MINLPIRFYPDSTETLLIAIDYGFFKRIYNGFKETQRAWNYWIIGDKDFFHILTRASCQNPPTWDRYK